MENGVAVAADGREVVLSGARDGKAWTKRLSPAEAASLWRCLTGETDKAQTGACGDGGYGLCLIFDGAADRWKLCDGKPLAWLDADEAMALAWGVRECAARAMGCTGCTGRTGRTGRTVEPAPPVEIHPDTMVWIMSRRWVDRMDGGIFGAAEAFSRRESAYARLRGRLKDMLYMSEGEGHWYERSIEDALDELIGEATESDEGTTEWEYDGSAMAFSVSISRMRIVR